MRLSTVVAPLYVAASFALIGWTVGDIPGEEVYRISAGRPALWTGEGFLRFATVILPLAAAVLLAAVHAFFRSESRRTLGMLIGATALIGCAIWAGFHWNSRGLLSAAWPGMLGISLVWVRDLDRTYKSGQTWKWELFFAVLFTLAILAFIPYALMLALPTDPGHYRFLLATVVTHGVGLLLCLFVLLKRLSPRDQTPGLMQILGLCARVVAGIFRSSSQHGDMSMTIATVSNSLTDLLAEMMVGRERTIMYTDIRSSTEIVERLGTIDSYRLFMKSWNVSRSALRRWNATTPKDLGDGLITTFPSAREAVFAAGAILSAHEEHNRRVGPEERMELKIGLHTGSVLLHYGWDPRGRDSHLAQRVVATAEPGTILMTRGTADAASAEGLTLSGDWRRGVELKGIAEAVDLYAVTPGAIAGVAADQGVKLEE
ncbi:MAG: adenylate/guanylate cyclase domain-containing protein [Planctomycetota bacterium]|jgi:class 3 adenylate cyclase